MKVMLVNTYYYPEIVGGAEYSVKKLAEGLKEAGEQVVVLCTGDSYASEEVDGIKIIRIKAMVPCRAVYADKASSYKKAYRRLLDIWNIRNTRIIEEIIRAERPNVIHTNGLYDISPVVWKVAKKHGVRVVHTLRDYFLPCPNVSLDCENNGGKCRFKYTLCPMHRKSNIKALERYVDVLTAPSAITLNKVLMVMGVRDIPGKVIPNAIDFDLDDIKKIYDLKNDSNSYPVKFVYLGTLSEKKGVYWLLESFEKVKNEDAELYIAGKGELENVVRDYCSMDSRIHFVGFLEEADMNQLLEKMHVLVCPSLWDEPFGRVVLDAYKHAMPVIASKRGALSELVDDGKTGRLIEANSQELCLAIERYTDNPNIILDQSFDCIQKLKNYSIERQINEFKSIYIA